MAPLRVMTLNIGSLFEAEWDRRRHEVVAWIDRVEPDIVCLQEVHESTSTDNTAEWIAARSERDWEVVFGGFALDIQPDPSLRFGSAVLSRWPIEHHALHRLPIADDADDPIPALMPWELLYARTNDIDVFSTHLAPAPHHGLHRRLQVTAIDEIIKAGRGDQDRFKGPGQPRTAMPPILCGDFNAEPDSDEIRWLCGLTVIDEQTTFYQDAWRVAGTNDPGYTQDWRTHPLAATLNVHRKRIDYVFVGDPFMRAGGVGRVLSAEVVCDKPLLELQASDHRGLVIEIEAGSLDVAETDEAAP